MAVRDKSPDAVRTIGELSAELGLFAIHAMNQRNGLFGSVNPMALAHATAAWAVALTFGRT